MAIWLWCAGRVAPCTSAAAQARIITRFETDTCSALHRNNLAQAPAPIKRPCAPAGKPAEAAPIGLPLPRSCLGFLLVLQPPSCLLLRPVTASKMAPDPAMLQRQSFLSRVSQRVSQELIEPPQQVATRCISCQQRLQGTTAATAACPPRLPLGFSAPPHDGTASPPSPAFSRSPWGRGASCAFLPSMWRGGRWSWGSGPP